MEAAFYLNKTISSYAVTKEKLSSFWQVCLRVCHNSSYNFYVLPTQTSLRYHYSTTLYVDSPVHHALHMGLKSLVKVQPWSQQISVQKKRMHAACVHQEWSQNGQQILKDSLLLQTKSVSSLKPQILELSHPVLIATTEPRMPYWSQVFLLFWC